MDINWQFLLGGSSAAHTKWKSHKNYIIFKFSLNIETNSIINKLCDMKCHGDRHIRFILLNIIMTHSWHLIIIILFAIIFWLSTDKSTAAAVHLSWPPAQHFQFALRDATTIVCIIDISIVKMSLNYSLDNFPI